MDELSSDSKVVALWVAWRGPVTVDEVTNATGLTLLTVLGVLPRLVDSGYVSRDGDVLRPGSGAPSRP